MADNTLLQGAYSMLTQGFIQAGLRIPALDAPAATEVVLAEVFHPRHVPEARFPVHEAPVLAGFMPSEQFPGPVLANPYAGKANKPWPAFQVHGGYRPVAALAIVEFDGHGGLKGNVIAMLDGNPAIESGGDFLPAMNEVPIHVPSSGYEVDPDGRTARARIAFNFGSGSEPELHVLVYFLTILKCADELHFLAIAAGQPTIQSGVMKRTWTPADD